MTLLRIAARRGRTWKFEANRLAEGEAAARDLEARLRALRGVEVTNGEEDVVEGLIRQAIELSEMLDELRVGHRAHEVDRPAERAAIAEEEVLYLLVSEREGPLNKSFNFIKFINKGEGPIIMGGREGHTERFEGLDGEDVRAKGFPDGVLNLHGVRDSRSHRAGLVRGDDEVGPLLCDPDEMRKAAATRSILPATVPSSK